MTDQLSLTTTKWPETVTVLTCDQRVLLPKCHVAASAWRRMRGLLGHEKQWALDGLLLLPCNAIHTIGMSYAIDAIFLDKHAKIIAIESCLKSGRLLVAHFKARAVLELFAEQASQLSLATEQSLCFHSIARQNAI